MWRSVECGDLRSVKICVESEDLRSVEICAE